MTTSTARTIANVFLVSAGLAAAYVVLSTPRLRRLTATGVRVWLGASVPVYLARQAASAWAESGRVA